MGIISFLELPRPDLPTCTGPRIVWYVNSASDVLTEDSAPQYGTFFIYSSDQVSKSKAHN